MAQSAVAMALPAARLAMPELAGTIQVVDQGGKMLTTVCSLLIRVLHVNMLDCIAYSSRFYMEALSADNLILKNLD